MGRQKKRVETLLFRVAKRVPLLTPGAPMFSLEWDGTDRTLQEMEQRYSHVLPEYALLLPWCRQQTIKGAPQGKAFGNIEVLCWAKVEVK